MHFFHSKSNITVTNSEHKLCYVEGGIFMTCDQEDMKQLVEDDGQKSHYDADFNYIQHLNEEQNSQ